VTKPRIRPNPDAFLYATQAAEELGVCVRTVIKMIKAGQLPGFQAGRQFRIPVDAWQKFKAGEWRPVQRPTPMPAPEMLRKRRTG
jgi:excisionase family DNA binding protein